MNTPPSPPPTHAPLTQGGNAAFHNFHNEYSHITDPNLRRRLALAEVDQIPFGWYHVRAVTVAGVGFFTDSYDIFAINLITAMLGMTYWQGEPIPGSRSGGNRGILPTDVSTAIKAATSGGTVVGQLGFGWLADVVGRRKMYGVELGIIILSTFAQSLAAPSRALTITGLLIFWRVVMGIGIGGDYPLSAVITSEFAPTRWRGGMMAAVFSMQGAGQFAAALVALISTIAFKDSFINSTSEFSSCNAACQLAADRSWRIIVGFGALPACGAMYYRITIPETPRYTFDVAHDIEKAQADIKAYMNNKGDGKVDPIMQEKTKQKMGSRLDTPAASWRDVYSYFSQWHNFKILFGTTTSWFFLDLAFYGLGLNNSIILNEIGYSTGRTIYHTLLNNAIGNIVLVCAGSLPGYWLSVLTIDTIGRKPIQTVGFFLLTAIFCVIGFGFQHLSQSALLTLYVLAQFFFNFGPNTTTFIIPGECFPTRYRSTGHGLSAASGKVGAIIAQVIAQPLLTKGAARDCKGTACQPWLDRLMQIFALFMFAGTLVSLLVPETKGWTLEEMSGEGSTPLDGRGNGGGGGGRGGGASSTGREAESSSRRRRVIRSTNPFVGGKTAGFSYQRRRNLGPRSPGLRGKRQRVGIMTSPEMLAQSQAQEQEKLRAKKEKSIWKLKQVPESKNGRSDEKTSEALNTISTAAHGARGIDEEGNGDEAFINGRNGTIPRPASTPLPGWGAGWGVQRPTAAGGIQRVDSIQLLDVGKLLK